MNGVQSPRDRVLARISSAADHLSVADLELAPCQIECLAAHRGNSHRKEGGHGIGLEIIAKLATILEVEPAELLRT